MNPADRWSGRGRFDDLPIQLKASLASALLLICLLALGAHAYLTSTRSAAGLRVLSGELVPKQQAFADVGNAVVATHMKIFRLVSWASNGVSDKVLIPLEVEINAELDASSERIAALTRRPDLSDDERPALQELLVKWQNCKKQARDTIDVARTDAPMATMMIGQTDDSFEAVDADLRKMSQALAAKSNKLQDQLSTDAQRNQQVVVWVTLLGLLISVVVAVVIGRSIVRPIRSITDVMQRLSAGEIDVPVNQGTRRDEIGQMALAIDVFRRNIIDKHAVERTLAESIEAITEGFSLYDAEDRLVVCNSHYREIFSYGADTVTPGMTFERIVGAAVGRVVLDGAGDGQTWLAERIARHRNPTGPHVQHRSDGSWIRVSERLTAAGGVVATYTDITELKSREADLDRAHAQVTALNEKLRSDNLRMEGELDVTRRLQMMLLPTLQELQQVRGLDIACHMQAALEVGGDYYDVLQHEGRVKIGIGDVTGHGLESGVVMLMTQAIVRALLSSGEVDPVRFLSVLNTALYGNVQRMGSDKNLTLCLLDYADGEVKVSGQHEQVIVLRRDGTVEWVDTIDLGFPIGLESEIAEFVAQATLRLQPGDGVVLYTDGVTEAADMTGEQYGLERLAAVLQAHWAQPAEAIKQAVVSDLKRFIGAQNVYDDITLVVAKQTLKGERTMAQTFGDFVELLAGDGEYLKIGFHPSSIPLQQRWRNNGLSADFLADYLSTFFPGEDLASAERQSQIKDAVGYIANELLENCMKYSHASKQHLVSIEMFLEPGAITLYTSNGIAPARIVPFQAFIQRLLTEDIDALYTEQLERNAADDDGGSASGMGFLTMLSDYGVKIAWNFSTPTQPGDEVAVTTMVRMPL